MFSKTINKFWHTLAFKLTLQYALIFIVSLFGAFFIFYIIVSNTLQRNIDDDLLEELREVSDMIDFLGIDSTGAVKQVKWETEERDEMFLRVLDRTGKVLITSDMTYWKTAGINTQSLNQINAGKSHVFETQTIQGRQHGVRVLYGPMAAGKIMQIGVTLEEKDEFLNIIKIAIAPIMILFLLISAMIGWFIARNALSDVEKVSKTAHDISNGDFSRRVQTKSKNDEIRLLAENFNRMLDHIHELMNGLKELTDNIAHDLKTPITRMRMASESIIVKAECNEECQNLAANNIEECDNLLQMIDTMLMISKEESGISEKAKESVNLSQIIKDALELFSPIADEKKIQCLNQVPDNVVIMGDYHGLHRMIINLLENAIKYTNAGGSITVAAHVENNIVQIIFHDTGIGISEEDLPHIFERLYRCDKSRNQQGFGLGLSLARAVAKAHLGDITVTSQPDKGSTFTVLLPV